MTFTQTHIDSACQAWEQARHTNEPKSSIQAMIQSLGALGMTKPVIGKPLDEGARTACAERISVALERLRRVGANADGKNPAIHTIVADIQIDLGDSLADEQDNSSCA